MNWRAVENILAGVEADVRVLYARVAGLGVVAGVVASGVELGDRNPSHPLLVLPRRALVPLVARQNPKRACTTTTPLIQTTAALHHC